MLRHGLVRGRRRRGNVVAIGVRIRAKMANADDDRDGQRYSSLLGVRANSTSEMPVDSWLKYSS